jgi:hypothetical protein
LSHPLGRNSKTIAAHFWLDLAESRTMVPTIRPLHLLLVLRQNKSCSKIQR